MDLRLLYAILLTIAPITELRVGLPLAISYAIDKGIPVFPIFILILLVNILAIFLVFFFLDKIHHALLNINLYKKTFDKWLEKFQKKVDKFEKRYNEIGFIALILFVAVPLPGTGAWSGCLVSWLLGLDRRKSIWAISAGIVIAGLLVLIGSLGFISFLA